MGTRANEVELVAYSDKRFQVSDLSKLVNNSERTVKETRESDSDAHEGKRQEEYARIQP
jgi:hypothetical protein